MFGRDQVPDKDLLKQINKRLQRGGGGALSVDVQRGTVTIRGKIRYEMQRRPILKLLNAIPGVRRVIDLIQLGPGRHSWTDEHRG